MIQLNNEAYPYTEGMTVSSLMAEKKFVFKDIIVRINDRLIDDREWPYTPINDGDDVKMIHIFGGG